ncbi:ECF transporter S component [Bifidobacterium eulemuris]|uniref:ABC transporter permease n=1 Tax=Bifidobacterium eulemuris TaxID=1765219 RepID=A0A261G7L7_9BIFI|nr:ECF transporter S component [Bifidobacterium eulemuris]OZG67420.1 ABC transporter permease [Bifidobacterium eulemuris]QOL32988.1 ECF transporter S component [Bifidobacterium eulemuris]
MTSSEQAQRPDLRWRVTDITTTAVIAVASGLVFWGAGLISEPLGSMLAIVPGMQALIYGVFYFAGPLAAVIVRKPGAALFCELVAAMVEAVIGSHWGGAGTILPGIVQGLGAELAFLFFAYRMWNIGVTMLAGALSAVGGVIVSYFLYNVGMSLLDPYMVVNLLCNVISGAVIAGALTWWLYKAIAATGALDRLAGGRDARVIA